MMGFVSLYNQSEYCFLNSTLKINELTKKASEFGYHSLGIADNNMSGVFKFYQSCIKSNIKPIIGLSVSVKSSDQNPDNVLLYAMDNIGYQNLLKISSRQSCLNEPLSLDYLQENNEGILAVLPSEEHSLVIALNNRDFISFESLYPKYLSVFSYLYMGLNLKSPSIRNNIDNLLKYTKQNNIKTVGINPVMFLDRSDFESYTILKSIKQGGVAYHPTYLEQESYFLSPSEIHDLYNGYLDLALQTEEIASLCNVDLRFTGYKMPGYLMPKEEAKEYFNELCKVGLNKRLRTKRVPDVDVYRDRLLYELDIIHEMEFEEYFLVVYDFVRYAKVNDILVGPGRGSAPGSLISYSLGITDVDPIEHGLFFERFLNPERSSLPDIDLDFPDNKRDIVIKYVADRYSHNKVAHISTFGTFLARSSIRDVARVLNTNDMVLNEVLKHIPSSETNLKRAIDNSVELQEMISKNVQAAELISLALKLEGLPRHISTHAAGIIVSNEELVNYTALRNGVNDIFQTQLDADDLEAIGLVKIDFLGLKNLTIIEDVIEEVKKAYNITIDFDKIPFDDERTYKLLANGDTLGIFQLESSGMTEVLRLLKCSDFIDIVHANALFRPGPKEMINTFARRKFKQERIEYLHPDLEPILKDTYGIIVFQEQIMQIARQFAGYTLGEADILRRGISKKDARVLEQERVRFVKGCINKGYKPEVGNEIYDYIVKFADYGFNKSHAVAYSMISYKMAYLKANFYPIYMSVLLNHNLGDIKSLNNIISECRYRNLMVEIPSVNYSNINFSFNDNKIYFALAGIKGLRRDVALKIIDERSAQGLYTSYYNFIERTNDFVNEGVIEALVYSGALDCFGLTRKQMIKSHEDISKRIVYQGLFDSELTPIKKDDSEFSFKELSDKEKENLGLNIKYNLFIKYQDYRRRNKIRNVSSLGSRGKVDVLVIVSNIRDITTKKGDPMSFVELYDDSGKIDGVLFPRQYQKIRKDINVEGIYHFKGQVELRNDKKQLIIESVYILE